MSSKAKRNRRGGAAKKPVNSDDSGLPDENSDVKAASPVDLQQVDASEPAMPVESKELQGQIVETTTRKFDTKELETQLEAMKLDLARISNEHYQVIEKLDITETRLVNMEADKQKLEAEKKALEEQLAQRIIPPAPDDAAKETEVERLQARITTLEEALIQQQKYSQQARDALERNLQGEPDPSSRIAQLETQLQEAQIYAAEYQRRLEAPREAPIQTSQSATRVKRTTQQALRNHWKHDSAYNCCVSCMEYFTIFNRRHHCRKCGLIFCATCCPAGGQSAWIGISGDGSVQFVPKNTPGAEWGRVCQACFLN